MKEMTVSTEAGDVPLFLGSVAFLASFVSLLALCVCRRFRKRLKNDEEAGLGERLSNHQVACQVASDQTILPVYGPSDSNDGERPHDGGGGGGGGGSGCGGRGFLGISSSRRKSRNSTIDRALPEIPGVNNGVGAGPTAADAGRGSAGGGGAGGGVAAGRGVIEPLGLAAIEADPNYDLILGNEKGDSERSSSAVPNTLPPSRDPIYSSVRGEDSSISEGMYAKVQEPRANGAPPAIVAGSARPGAMAMEVNGRTGQPPLAIREHEYSRIRSVDEENLYFKVGSDSGSESGYAHVHAREASFKRASTKAGGEDGGRVATISTLALEHGVVVTGDEMYAEIRKTSNPDSGDTDVAGNASFGAFDPTTLENLYAFPPPVPEKQFDLNDSYDPELLQTVQSIPYIDEAGFTSPTSPDLPPRNSVGGFSLAAGGSTTPPPTAGALSIFSQTSSLSSINNTGCNANNSGSHKTPSLASATSSSSTIVNAGAAGGGSSVGASSIRGDDNGAHSHPFAREGLSLNQSAQAAGPDDKKDYVIITARESVPVLQARRAQEAAAKELAEKKRRHVYQNVNGGAGAPSPMDDSSDSENYAKVIDPVSLPSYPLAGPPQRHSTPATTLATAKPPSSSSTPNNNVATNGWVRREHTYSTVDGEEQLYSEVPEPPIGSGDDDDRRRMLREPIDPPPPPEAFHALMNSSTAMTTPHAQDVQLRHQLPHQRNLGDSNNGLFSSSMATDLSSTSPPHVTSVLVAQDDDDDDDDDDAASAKSQRSKLDQAMNELNAEPPYTTIVEPFPAAAKPTDQRASTDNTARDVVWSVHRNDDDDDDDRPDEPPYTQISVQTTHSAVEAHLSSTTPSPLQRQEQQHQQPPTPQRHSQPLPKRPTNENSSSSSTTMTTPLATSSAVFRRLEEEGEEEEGLTGGSGEEPPYTAITNCTSGAIRIRASPSSTTSRDDGEDRVAATRDVEGLSVVAVGGSSGCDSLGFDDASVRIAISNNDVAPHYTSAYHQSASKPAASGHVTTIEISGAKHTIHGDL